MAINCIDLTTLAGDDTPANVGRLCWRATRPLSAPIVNRLKELGHEPITTGAVCVYPLRVADCRHYLDKFGSKVPIASVVTGFPAGQGAPSCTLDEIEFAVKAGANEIDIVINRTLVLTGQWRALFDEIKPIAEHCHRLGAHLKVILSYGELATLDNVYRASMVAMLAGTDFIKTSTGKETINAKLAYGLMMTRSIRDYYQYSGRRVGLKPAGGLKEADDALAWVVLVRHQLGAQWLELFRLGASSLLSNIEKELFAILFERKPDKGEINF